MNIETADCGGGRVIAWTGGVSAGSSPFGKHFSQETQDLGHIQLHVLQIEKMLVVLLLDGGKTT